MTSKKLLDVYLKWLFEPQSPVPIALFRIFLGILILQSELIHVGKDVLAWYGPHGVVTLQSIKTHWWWNQPHLDLFLLFPQTDAGTLNVWYILVAATVMMTVGLFSRAASIVVCLGIISMHNHQPFNINGGDAMVRLYCGYLIFSDSGAAISFDRLLRRMRHPTFGEASRPKLIAPWGQRMLQVQLALSYWSTFCHKISGKQWLDGTAVYYATRLDDMTRVEMPFLYDSPLFCKFLTWYTLVVEGAMFTLVWLRDFRYYVLIAAIFLHLGIDFSINLPVFEWAFMSGFVLFIYPEDLSRCMDFIKARITSSFGPAAPLLYNTTQKGQVSIASVLEGLDVLGRLQIASDEAVKALTAQSSSGVLTGVQLFAWLTARLPLLWPFYPFIGLPFQILCQRRSDKAPAA